jgi:hypothetical protein
MNEPAFAGAFLIAGVALLLRQTASSWGMYVLPALVLGAYGFARTATFALFDASLFPGTEIRYLLPAAVAFTAVGAWLWAAGLHHVGAALLGRADVSATNPAARVIIAALFLLASAALFYQWGYNVRQPPDTYQHVGMVRADAEHISGWARLKERPEPPVQVEIFIDGTLAAVVDANRFDDGLVAQHIGTGNHAFSYPTPPTLKDGRPHTIRAKIAGTNYELVESPRQVTFPAPEPTKP